MRPMRALVLAWVLTGVLAGVGPVAAEEGLVRSPVLVVATEQLYSGSAYGARIEAEVAAQSAQLAAENRRIEAELEQEEKDLTALRAGMAPTEFRVLANAFDDKVRAIRREQESKARNLLRQQDAGRQGFMTAAAPVLERMMREAGAAVILEQQSVFLSLSVVDITQEAIGRIDSEIGDGGSLAPDK